jgi:hypothetical protein
MAAQSTYTPIATVTLGSYNNVTFSSIPQTYTDLVIVAYSNTQQSGSIADVARLVINGGATGVSSTILSGNGSSATSTRETTTTSGGYLGVRPAFATNLYGVIISHIMNYSNTTSYKTIISRAISDSNGSGLAQISALTWPSITAITSLTFGGTGNYPGPGTMITLYGITAA